MFWFIPEYFKPTQCETTFCFSIADVLVDGIPYCLQHGTNALLTGASAA